MSKKRAKAMSDEQFTRTHAPYCQDIADFTGQPTALYRSAQGIGPRCVVDGWPCEGKKLAVREPNRKS